MLQPHQKVPIETFCVGEDPINNDQIMNSLSPGAIIINATGKGKDSPGSPVTDNAPWPDRALVWEFNYRGDLVFLDQAKGQQEAKDLKIEDGWIYFIHGWSAVIADVFDVEIPTSGELLENLSRVAASVRK